jgi:hypothetical protein
MTSCCFFQKVILFYHLDCLYWERKTALCLAWKFSFPPNLKGLTKCLLLAMENMFPSKSEGIDPIPYLFKQAFTMHIFFFSRIAVYHYLKKKGA